MTPRRFDPDLVQRRLADVRLALERLDEIGPVDPAQLGSDWRLRAITERLLTVLVEAAVACNGHIATSTLGRAPPDYRSSFLDAAEAGAIDEELGHRLAPSAGLRNVLVHGYDDVDLRLLARGAQLARETYPLYIEQVGRFAFSRGRPERG